MSFDMRQNVLMVRSLIHGQPFYNFYNAEGLEFTLPGYQLKEIYDCHFEGRMSAVTTYWGFTNKPNYESFEFADNGDLLWHVSLNAVCHTYLPLEMVIGHEGFNVINGFMIEDHKRTVMKIHQKAVGRSVDRLMWFRDMSEERMREMLNALGHGPLRIERADRDELIKIHTEWQRKHDEEFKYTHNAIGLDPDEKLPADLYDDHGRRITRRMLAAHKTVEMMAEELSNLIRIFKLDPESLFDHNAPSWELGLCLIARAFIYNEDAKDRLSELLNDPQFVVNGIYALARDMTWIHINENTFDYQQSVIRRLMQELQNDIQADDSNFDVQDGKVYLIHMLAEKKEEVPVASVNKTRSPTPKAKKVKVTESNKDEKFPAVRREKSVIYEGIRGLMQTRKFQNKYSIYTNNATPDELLTVLHIAVMQPRDDWFEKLSVSSLAALASSLTVVKLEKAKTFSETHLKNVIKRALQMLDVKLAPVAFDEDEEEDE